MEKDVRAQSLVKVSSKDIFIFYPFSFYSEGEIVRWSTDGSKFVVQSGSTIDLYSTVAIFKFHLHVHEVTSFVRRTWIYCFQSNIPPGCTMSRSVNALMGKGRCSWLEQKTTKQQCILYPEILQTRSSLLR